MPQNVDEHESAAETEANDGGALVSSRTKHTKAAAPMQPLLKYWVECI